MRNKAKGSEILLKDGGHPAEEMLLAYLDGELEAATCLQIRRHLESCTRCGDRIEGFGSAIADAGRYWQEVIETTPPPRGFLGFERRLRESAAEEGRRFSFAQLLRPLKRVRLDYAAVCAVVLFVIIICVISLSSPVNAVELLNRSASSELQTARRVSDPVFYQKLLIRRMDGRQPVESVTLEDWDLRRNSRLAYRGGGKVWAELERIYQLNHMGGLRPLGPRTYAAWRSSLSTKQEQVAQWHLPDGSPAFRLTTVRTGELQVGEIAEAHLVVRTTDWHPVQEILRVQDLGAAREYELNEQAFAVMALPGLDPAILASLGVANTSSSPWATSSVTPPLKAPRPATPKPLALDPDDLEVRALYVLHQLRACLGEPVEVGREPSGRIAVRGTVDTDARRDELLSALRELPGLQLDIETAEDYLKTHHPEPAATSSPSASRIAGPESQPPLQEELQKRLNQEQITSLSNQVITLTDELQSHAWAVRRLSQRYSSAKLPPINPESRQLLAQMLREHVATMHADSKAVRKLLEPLLPMHDKPAEVVPGADWREGAKDLFDAAEQQKELLWYLFTGEGTPQPSDAALMSLATSLDTFETRCRLMEDEAAHIAPQTRTEAAQGGSPNRDRQ